MLSIAQSHNFLQPPSPSPRFTTRRMSEHLPAPALYQPQDQYAQCRYNNNLTSTAFAYNPSPRPFPLYSAHLHRGASTGDLRDLRHHHADFPPDRHNFIDNRPDPYDEPISPLQPNFSGGLTSPYSLFPLAKIHTGLPPWDRHLHLFLRPTPSQCPCMPCSPTLSFTQHLQRSISTPNMAAEAVDRKTYAFVALPGNAVKKRPRRRYDEIERLYQCSWPECTKAYGTLNHLNAHVTMQKHGPKRTPDGMSCP
jgi:hypothetical protein